MRKTLLVLFVSWISITCGLSEAAPSPSLPAPPTSSVSPESLIFQQNEALIEKYKVIVENQDKRLSDIWGSIGILGYIAALLGVLTTAIVVFFSLRSASTAVAEAKIEAGKTIESWLKSNAEKLLVEETKKVIAPQLDHALREIKDAATPILVALDAELQKTVKLNEDLSAKNGGSKVSEADEGSPADQPANEQEQYNSVQNQPPSAARAGENFCRADLRTVRTLKGQHRYAEAIAIIDLLSDKLRTSADEKDQLVFYEACYERIAITEALGDNDTALSEYKELVSRLIVTKSPGVASVLAKILYSMALLEEEVGDVENAINTCDKVISIDETFNFSGRQDVTRLLRTLSLKTRCLFSIKKYKLVIECYEYIQQRLSSEQLEEPINSAVARNIELRFARSLVFLARPKEAKEFLSKTIGKYATRSGRSRSNDPAPLKLMLASILDDEDNYQEALALCASIIQDYQENIGIRSANFVMQALLRKAAILSKLGLPQEEISVYDEIIEIGSRKVASNGWAIQQEYIATAMVNKAITLTKLGRSPEALLVTNEILSKFNANIDQAIVEQTTKAAKLKTVLER